MLEATDSIARLKEPLALSGRGTGAAHPMVAGVVAVREGHEPLATGQGVERGAWWV